MRGLHAAGTIIGALGLLGAATADPLPYPPPPNPVVVDTGAPKSRLACNVWDYCWYIEPIPPALYYSQERRTGYYDPYRYWVRHDAGSYHRHKHRRRHIWRARADTPTQALY